MRFPTTNLNPISALPTESDAQDAITAANQECLQMCGWLNYLQTNHIDLWQIYLDEVEQVKQASPKGEGFINMLKLDQEWAARVNELLKAKVQTA